MVVVDKRINVIFHFLAKLLFSNLQSKISFQHMV